MKGRPNHIRCVENVGVFLNFIVQNDYCPIFTIRAKYKEYILIYIQITYFRLTNFACYICVSIRMIFFFIVNTSDVSKSECKMHDCFSFYICTLCITLLNACFPEWCVAIYKSNMS